MSFFFCCGNDPNAPVYEIQSKDSTGKIVTEKIRSIEDVDPKKLQYASRVLRVEESEYQQLLNQHSPPKKWTDPQFPPGKKSLGKIENIPEDCEWKRVSQILNRPELFDGKVEPKDVIQGSLGSCYFLSAVAALAEVQERIYGIFGDQKFTPSGIYRVKLRVNGTIKQILIDDYIPVNKSGKPLFCQPNKNQFWVIILEKAWAKINKSYSNILSGTPTDVFEAVTYAPSNLKLIKSGHEHQNKLWEEIKEHTEQNRPCCCGAKKRSVMQEMGLANRGIIPGHAYTLLDSATLQDDQHLFHKIVKLRDPWGNKEWAGRASQSDKVFWNSLEPSAELSRLQAPNEMGEDGIFFMTFEDFCEYFNEINFCNLLEKPNYEVETFTPDSKNGNIHVLNVKTEGDYMIQLHQSIEKEVAKKSKNRESAQRESIPEEVKEENKEEGYGEKVEEAPERVHHEYNQNEELGESNAAKSFVKEYKHQSQVRQSNHPSQIKQPYESQIKHHQSGIRDTYNEGNNDYQQQVRQSGMNGSGIRQSGMRQSGVHESGIRQSGANQSGIRQSGVHQSGVRQSGVRQSHEDERQYHSKVEPYVSKEQEYANNLEQQGPNRLTLLLIQANSHEFVDGVLKYNELGASIKARLHPGKYVVKTKADPHPESGSMPVELNISTYGKHFVEIKASKKENHPKLLQKTFLQHARHNKKKEYDDGKMWISWKLFYEKGGFAYIAFGVEPNANKKFKVQLSEKDFNELNFMLKKPHKGKEKIELEVNPGEEEVVVARVKNGEYEKMMFPPPLLIEMEEILKKKK